MKISKVNKNRYKIIKKEKKSEDDIRKNRNLNEVLIFLQERENKKNNNKTRENNNKDEKDDNKRETTIVDDDEVSILNEENEDNIHAIKECIKDISVKSHIHSEIFHKIFEFHNKYIENTSVEYYLNMENDVKVLENMYINIHLLQEEDENNRKMSLKENGKLCSYIQHLESMLGIHFFCPIIFTQNFLLLVIIILIILLLLLL